MKSAASPAEHGAAAAHATLLNIARTIALPAYSLPTGRLLC
jgi:hypothetical protein